MNKLSKTIALSVVLLMLVILISMQIRSLNPRKLLSTNDNAEFYMLQEEVMNLMR